MYEVCKSATGRNEPTFDIDWPDQFQNASEHEMAVAPETRNIVLVQDAKYSTLNFMKFAALILIVAAPLCVGYLYFEDEITFTSLAHLDESENSNRQTTTQIREIDLTQTNTIKPVDVKRNVSAVAKAGVQNDVVYTVQSGDTLGKIGIIYKVRVTEVMELNNLTNPNAIRPGMKLIISRQN